MAVRDRRLQRAEDRARRSLAELGADIRSARLAGGLTQRTVGRRVRRSHSQLSRIERGLVPNVSVALLARISAIVGMSLFVRAYPDDRPVRDATHAALARRFVGRLHPTLEWRSEVPVGGGDDPRSWDGGIHGTGTITRVELETRIHDGQALQRRLARKRRDDPAVARLILVVADTRTNRSALAVLDSTLAAAFPGDGRSALASLAAGRDPGQDAIVLV